MLLGTQIDNSVQFGLGVDADMEVRGGRKTQSCTTHLEDLNCATIPKGTVEFPLSQDVRHHISLQDGHLIRIAGIGGEAALCHDADCVDDHDEAEASKQHHICEQD